MWVSRPGLSPVMVGRDGELDALRALVDASDRPRVALVTGEAGVGKSRLVREFLSGLDDRVAVLAGQAEEGDLNHPYELLRDAAEPLVQGWDSVPAVLDARAHPLAHLLAPMLPLPHPDDDHGHAADELQRAAVDLVRHLVRGGPAVLVLEDLHWADADSVALLGRLATTPDLPLLVVATFRPEDFDRRHPLAALLPVMERQRPVLHLSLGRLARHELAAMLEAVYGRAPSPETVVTLHRRTQGNPFFVEELLATAGSDDPEALTRVSLPWNAAEAVLRRLDALEPEERAVVDAAAVLAGRVPFDLLAEVTELDEDRLIAVLRHLVGHGLLSEGDNDSFSFRHALSREAVATQLLGRQRRRLHERALRALRESGSTDDALLAHHAAGAGHHAELVAAARGGAEKYLREGSGLLAVRLAELGLTGADQLAVPPVADELALHSVATRAALVIGLSDLASRHAEQWRALAAEAGVDAELAAALRHLALLRFYAGDNDAYWALLDEALEVAGRLGPSEELGWCLAYRSQAHMFTDEHAEAIEWADRAVAIADAVDAPEVRAYALVNKGTALCALPGCGERGAALLVEARAQARRANDMLTLTRGYSNALLYELESGRWAEARRLLDDGWAVAERHGLDGAAAKMASLGVSLAFCEGDGAAAARWLDKGRRTVAAPASELWLLRMEGALALERGDVEAAATALQRLRDEPERRRGGKSALFTAQLAAAVAATRHDAPAAAAVLDDAREGLRHLGRDTVVEAAYGIAVDALVAGVDPDTVQGFLAAVAGDAPEDRHAGLRAAVAGLTAERRGDPEAAATAYRASLAAPQSWRGASTMAELHLRLARCCGLLGDRQAAEAEAAAARDLLARWPGPRREAVEALLRRQPGAGTDLLTPREHEVVALVAEGLTNRQIADRLFISTKTAAVHVSNVLAKTGLSSRTEVAAWALRSGRVEQR